MRFRRVLLPLFVALAVIAGAVIVATDGSPDDAQAACNPARPRCTPAPTVPPGPTGTPTPTPTPTGTVTPPPPPSGTVGYVGCSNSAGAVDGYHLDGGEAMWPFIRNYGGGTVTVWANEITTGGQHWSAFTKNQQLDPASVFWLQLCALASEDQDNDDEARLVIAEILRRVPGATIYVSALNGFVAPHVCTITGAAGPANAQADTDELVASGDALEGPHLGALISRYQTPSAGSTLANNQTTTDGCHPNTQGKTFLGAPLVNFFG